jgi:DNA-binding transcriptional LysR family regulator
MLVYSLMPISNGLTCTGPQGIETVKIVPVLQSSNESLMRLAVLQGMGLAYLPKWQIAQDLEAGYLEPLLTDYQVFDAQLYGVYSSRKYLSSKVRTFLDFISEDLRLR